MIADVIEYTECVLWNVNVMVLDLVFLSKINKLFSQQDEKN